jgi:mRNA-degrading endonuclease toxin of MazEF toxin-antitoxin module
VLVCQVMTIDKELLTELVGVVPRRAMQQVDEGLKLALDLS